jgi:hypothetical protein
LPSIVTVTCRHQRSRTASFLHQPPRDLAVDLFQRFARNSAWSSSCADRLHLAVTLAVEPALSRRDLASAALTVFQPVSRAKTASNLRLDAMFREVPNGVFNKAYCFERLICG